MALAVPRRRYTPDDLLRMGDRAKSCELVDGRLWKRDRSALASFVAGQVLSRLARYVNCHNAGWLFSPNMAYKCFPQAPDDVLRPDSAFHQLDRLTAAEVRTADFGTVVPDLAVHVISRKDSASRMDARIGAWLGAGVPLLWVVNPDRRTVATYAGMQVKMFREADTLTGGPVLPGFAVPGADLFRLPA